MNFRLKTLVDEIGGALPQFAAHRDVDPLANDCYEAAWYWRDLGRWVLEGNTRVNYPERAKGEFMLIARLREFLAKRPPEKRSEFGRVLDAGEELLKIVSGVMPPKDGHLGFLRIIRAEFGFLESDFGFKVVQEEPTQIRFSSGDIFLELSHSVNPWLSCSFGPDVKDGPSYWIHDLLYLNGDERYKALPQRLDLDSEETTVQWFGFVAECFRRYGRQILSNADAVLQQLAAAQAKRDDEYVREMEMKHGPSTPPGEKA